jgi:hypothetical protein
MHGRRGRCTTEAAVAGAPPHFDFESGGSDALIDAVVAWGDPESLGERIREHYRAGADHVAVQPVARTLDQQLEDLRRLAPALAD